MKPKRYIITTTVMLTPQQKAFLDDMSIKNQMSVCEIIRDSVDSLMAKEGAI